jgi:undecaprenyl phosphate N,N'-diacetylbacillosamine 1-phosphate transferase
MITKPQATVKRGIDLLASAAGLVVLSPLLAVIAAAIRLDTPGSILYTSRRLGRGGREFALYKYRSMYQGSPSRYHEDGSMLVDKSDPRVTRVGRVLRVGFDELPQLWNVVRGEMSLIGPRPDLPYALDLYEGEESLRLRMRPGITGWAQVKGRTDIPWRDRLALDVEYVKTYSLRRDAWIAAATLVEFIPPLRKKLIGGKDVALHE